jgi:FAD/FMN-containing dehydrogenase
VHEHVAQHGLFWPVDFASKGSSQVGGNISTNAGGVRVIRYGLTRQWVLGLEVVTGTGQVLELNGALEKNNTGIDLRQVFIGSEGILGIVTAATLKLTRLPTDVKVMLFAVDTLDAVLRLFERARKGPFTVMAYEFFTRACSARLERHRKLKPPFEAPSPTYVLLEVEGAKQDALEAWVAALFDEKLVTDGTLAQSESQAKELWSLREGISESLSATGTPHKNDIALPIAGLKPFCEELEAVMATSYPGWEVCLFGHIGDGNLHVNVMKPDAMEKSEFLQKTHAVDETLMALVRAHGGSVSAEHGIGLLKKDWLGHTRSSPEIALMKQMKAIFDPLGVLNPGKVL